MTVATASLALVTAANKTPVLAVGDRMAAYHWFEYNGPKLNLENKNGVKVTLGKNEPIGMRQNPKSKYFFMIVMKIGPTAIFRLSAEAAEAISKKCSPI